MAEINTGIPAITPPSLKPASLPEVHLSLTIVYITLYSLLFLVVYVELWMILFYRHKRFSFQTVFLFLCLIWAGLRTTLFSFYFRNTSTANYLCTFFYWLLYCFPVCLQFFTLCLLVLFVAKIIFRARPDLYRYRTGLQVTTFLSMVVFTVTNITCAIITKRHEQNGISPPFGVVLARVIINDLLFIIYALVLSVSIYKISRLPSIHHVLDSLGTTKVQAIIACAIIIPLFLTRAVYNLIAISNNKINSFNFSWINVSDEVDIGGDVGAGYVSFGIILFVWEFLPTFIVVIFFRVKIPDNQMQMLPSAGDGSYNSGPYFFDNPRRYDSDDEYDHNSVPSRSSTQDSLNPRMFNAANPGPRHLDSFVQGTPPVLYASTDSHILPGEQNIQDYYDGT